MKKQFTKKLFACLPLSITLIFLILMFSVHVHAQIIYTDVNPDTSLTCSSSSCTKSYNLDLNNDSQVDFTLIASYNTTNCTEPGTITTKIVSVNPQTGNATTYTLMMNANDLIDSNLVFSASPGILRRLFSGSCVHSPSSGSWTSTSDRYLGLKLTVGTDTYYGWVRLNVVVATSASFTVKDYAYNSIPNQPILAGQTNPTGIDDYSFSSSIHLYPNPATNHLTIDLGSQNRNVEVTIIDMTGKIIPIAIGTTPSTDVEKIEVNTSGFAVGVYNVRIQTADFVTVQKFIVRR